MEGERIQEKGVLGFRMTSGGSVGASCKQEGVFFLLWFKVGQGGIMGASKFALAWEFCAKKEDEEGIPFRFREDEWST